MSGTTFTYSFETPEFLALKARVADLEAKLAPPAVAFPARALARSAQRIGLFVPFYG